MEAVKKRSKKIDQFWIIRFQHHPLLPAAPLKGKKTKNNGFTVEEKNIIEEKLLSGKDETISEMATDINGGQPSEEIEKIAFRNMMTIMLKKFDK